MAYKVYSKKRPYSYTWGAFPTFELIKHRPDQLVRVIVSQKTDRDIVEKLQQQLDPEVLLQDDALLSKLAQRQNVYVLGVYRCRDDKLQPGDHIVLDEPSNFGNLGTIIRTALGLGYKDIALIGQACDHHHPEVVRASMGAVFAVRIERFRDFAHYRENFPEQHCLAFMGGSDKEVSQLGTVPSPYSLLFGNESRGLDPKVTSFATPVAIAMDPAVDSFNITIAAGIGMYVIRRQSETAKV